LKRDPEDDDSGNAKMTPMYGCGPKQMLVTARLRISWRGGKPLTSHSRTITSHLSAETVTGKPPQDLCLFVFINDIRSKRMASCRSSVFSRLVSSFPIHV
jgi:hypothetical protein